MVLSDFDTMMQHSVLRCALEEGFLFLVVVSIHWSAMLCLYHVWIFMSPSVKDYCSLLVVHVILTQFL